MDVVNLPVEPAYNPETDDIVGAVHQRLQNRIERARSIGVCEEQVIVEPGVGFATDVTNDFELLARVRELADLGFPVVVGASRKSFITTSCRVSSLYVRGGKACTSGSKESGLPTLRNRGVSGIGNYG
ncbi:dihydropteroate synthase [Halogeometricum pallidum]|uniref:dihydropteroate synthase n=1 Tax=Halogeometricum pallidum TaxID=411361 RepID=UPI0019552785